MSPYAILGVMGVVNVPFFVLYGKLLFSDLQGFIDCVVFWLKPDLWSLLDGTYFEDWWGTFKLWVFFASCVAMVLGEYAALNYYLPNVFPALV